ncbi:glycoside hydrolase family 2 TIM barrel-domain containing protein [Pelagicoccus sp. SDUM812005]|uniref:glycoside hydrolase family 2 TIM barrel-domain containing protein n=1 Tax=Pelagicoccus sp. SDUM812005 TaxID=3041257 RepID=UPI00280EAD10|nr:glycoside hydrolase family 2 TIM barrel-domain containing protein [Pelagicoccus sp. SDUM812005]MDQ8181619.1 glycoside hydrolase family 2 TIM barrel-domain containing protein [Pelagicoccus sp. SDUM812005]
MKSLLLIAPLLLVAFPCLARSSFDADWKFMLADVPAAKSPAFDDSDWRKLDLPHDWSIEGEYRKDNPMGGTAGYLPAGIGWYRKTVEVPQEWRGKHVEIAFDGVYMNSEVWVNGQFLGRRPYGWISFSYDISKFIQESDTLTFAVRVDNEKQPSARWYTGSGIYAQTWIVVKEKVHVPSNGVFVRTEGNQVKVDTEVLNMEPVGKTLRLRTRIVDAEGREQASVVDSLLLTAGERSTVAQRVSLQNARRWDLDTPYLYRAISELEIDGEWVPSEETRFGVRDIEWKAESGMWINGRNVKLQGICNHQDAGALGAAVPDKILRFRIEQLKRMGVNAIRTAHNPQTPIFYDICDELGMLVMDEIFDGWRRKAKHDYGAYHFEEWWQRDVTDWIKRDRNHPSIVIYSVGNETHGEVAPDLVALCHELDDTRPVTSGQSGAQHMDVLGMNGGSESVGWFDGRQEDRVIIGTENTHTWQVRGYYRTHTWYRDGFPNKGRTHEIPNLTEEEIFTYDWVLEKDRGNRKQVFNSSYDNATVRSTARHNIEQIRDIPFFAGSFRWTGHDYIGEASYVHGGWPFRAFMGGAIDLANFEKDLYYLYQSQWTEEPMVHILPHWTHPTMELGTEIPVWVYSNCDEVELFFDGRSLGKQSPGEKWDEMQCDWMVPWKPGKLKAVGYRNGKRVSEQSVQTAGAPVRIALSVDGEGLAPVDKDVAQVRVAVTDEAGTFYPYGENRTFFRVLGEGDIRALDNGSPVDVEPHYGVSSRKAFYGLTRAYIESGDGAANVALLAGSILGDPKLEVFQRVAIDAQLLGLRGAQPEFGIEIFYTLDGQEPSRRSQRYDGPFPVEPGTTVRALVYLDGEPALAMQERFAKDLGFVWDSGAGALPAGESSAVDQAEDAKFTGATVRQSGKGFRGRGYLDFGNRMGSIELYQENDGGAGKATLLIRYSGEAKGKAGRTMILTVNGVSKRILLKNTGSWGSDWKVFRAEIELVRGANTIELSTDGRGGMYIDEIGLGD